MWIILVMIYSLAKGARDLIKKKALQMNTATEVLLVYSVLAFLLILPEAADAVTADIAMIGLAALKALILFVAYLCSFHAIRNLPISLYGVVDLSRMMFAIILGVAFLDELMGKWQIIGMILVSIGILLLQVPGKKKQSDDPAAQKRKIFMFIAFLQSFLNACSSVLDKVITQRMESGQLQFWFLFFMAVFYCLYSHISRANINWKSAFRNYWIWIISILFVFADRLLFIANAEEGSQVVIMTLLKRSGCIVTILGGRIFFRETRIGYKLLCAAIVLSGVLLAILLPA